MNRDVDDVPFTLAFARALSLYPASEASPGKAEAYFDFLDSLPIEAVVAGLAQAVRESPDFFPSGPRVYGAAKEWLAAQRRMRADAETAKMLAARPPNQDERIAALGKLAYLACLGARPGEEAFLQACKHIRQGDKQGVEDLLMLGEARERGQLPAYAPPPHEAGQRYDSAMGEWKPK